MTILKRLSQKNLPITVADLSTWPSVAVHLLPPEEIERYERYKGAIDSFVAGRTSLSSAAREFSISVTEFSRVLDRCLEMSDEGYIQGYRGIIRYRRQNQYSRRKETTTGTAGLLGRLFEEHPSIQKKVEKAFIKGKGFKDVFNLFLELLRETGVVTGYPFNTESLGREGLRLFLKKIENEKATEVAYGRYGKIAGRHAEQRLPDKKRLILRPYRRVELDAHRCDAYFIIYVRGPDGLWKPVTIERIWILILFEVASRAVLGYSISLKRQCSIEDVREVIQRAIRPPPPMALTIPGLAYKPGAGFPGQVIPACQNRLFDLLALDNALAHLSDKLHFALDENVQCAVNLGKSGHPDDRPFVERFFGTLTARGFKRTVSTTGSGPNDPRRKDPEKKAETYEFHLSEGEELLDVLLANYNAETHSSIYTSPLQYLRSYYHEILSLQRRIAEQDEGTWTMKELWVTATIRGSTKKGRRPYVVYEGAKYRNQALTANPSLIGKKLQLKINVDDLRTVEAYFEDGASIGILRAAGRWSLSRNSLTTRRLVCKLIRDKELDIGDEDPVVALTRHLEARARKSKKAASQHEAVQRELREERATEQATDGVSRNDNKKFQPQKDGWVSLRDPVIK